MRRDAWLAVAPLTPVVLLGVVLTLSLYGWVFGVPILLVTARPWWSALSVVRRRQERSDLSLAARTHLVLCAVTLAGTGLISFIYGLDDMAGVGEVLALVAGVLTVTALCLGVAGLVGGSATPAT